MLPHDCFLDPDSGEFIPNWSFDCGLYKWGFDPTYPAILTDNGDGSVHLKTDSNFGSLVPDDDTFPNGDWVLECKVRNVVGNGKLSIRRPNGTWVTNTLYTTDGTYHSNYSGIIAEIHVGADGDPTFEADYDYISLRKRVTDSVVINGELITHDGEEVVYFP
jgi:hypothetical protein